MRYTQIQQHLKPYIILRSRRTTINHAFASAIAPPDSFDDELVRESISELEQDPDDDLLCVYCGLSAETWDHVFATVQNSQFSGHGHRIGNLLPCCKSCNSRKGNKHCLTFLKQIVSDDDTFRQRRSLIERYINAYHQVDQLPSELPEYHELQEIRQQVLDLLGRADAIAARIRSISSGSPSTPTPRI